MRNLLTRQTEAQAASGDIDNTSGPRTLSLQRSHWRALRRQSGSQKPSDRSREHWTPHLRDAQCVTIVEKTFSKNPAGQCHVDRKMSQQTVIVVIKSWCSRFSPDFQWTRRWAAELQARKPVVACAIPLHSQRHIRHGATILGTQMLLRHKKRRAPINTKSANMKRQI